ncbi:hypothetical protein ACYPKM_00665 [Pseudomonas aeruginosa]
MDTVDHSLRQQGLKLFASRGKAIVEMHTTGRTCVRDEMGKCFELKLGNDGVLVTPINARQFGGMLHQLPLLKKHQFNDEPAGTNMDEKLARLGLRVTKGREELIEEFNSNDFCRVMLEDESVIRLSYWDGAFKQEPATTTGLDSMHIITLGRI